MKSRLVLLACLLAILLVAAAAFSQTNASMVGSVKDPTGATIANAEVTVTNAERGITRSTNSNADGEWAVPSLPAGKYDVSVTASGFKKYQAQGVILEVAQKARVDIAMQVGADTTLVTVEGTSIAQVETQSSDLTGTVTGKEISQLQLNGRNFTQLVTLVPGVSNQTGQDEGTVGVYGNVAYSINGGRTEYNNWELDGGDNMDNGSNTTLNVYPSLDAIGEFKVLTSNYGAQYGRNGSGTVEVETKSGTKDFHGDVYEFVRNDAFNARNYFQQTVPPYHKNDYGYTIGGPVTIPGLYNKDRQKTFFFWSQEWRKESVPGQTFSTTVPSAANRAGNFNDLCPSTNTPFPRLILNPDGTTSPAPFADCPGTAITGGTIGGEPSYNPITTSLGLNQLQVDPNAQFLLALIPAPNNGTNGYQASPVQPTNWRQELIRVDQNFTNNVRGTVRFIHDSWDTVTAVPLWTNVGNFPTVGTNFKGPGVGLVTRLTATVTPTLLNEFVFSYTADHIILNNTGNWKRPSGMTMPGLFNNGFNGSLPGVNLIGGVKYGGFGEDPGYIPNGPYNSNPTYTFRDNVSKIVGRHNLQFGAYVVAAQKNEFGGELSNGSVPGYLTFSTSSSVTTGNAFADLLTGQIASFGQQDRFVKYFNRYKIVEPYFQDDFHVTSRLTLNLGLRVSLFGTYREKEHQAFNFDPAHYKFGQTTVNPDGTVTNLTANGATPSVSNLPNGIVQCGVTPGVPVSCMSGHLFNAAPRVGFAWDPEGNGKTAIRGGYGIFYEHTNGNEGNTESLENSPPLANAVKQNNISGYANIGASTGTASPQFPLGVVRIPTKAIWPYVQQWHFDIQREVSRNTVATVSYVGSKGTHLTRYTNSNQLPPVSASQNPFLQHNETIAGGCTNAGFTLDSFSVPSNGTTPGGVPVPYGGVGVLSPAVNFGIADGCGTTQDAFRPFPGFGNINYLSDAASSIYHALATSVRRNVGSLTLSFSYTYAHSIDDSSSRGDSGLVNSYDIAGNRASSNFDQRHTLSLGWVWDVPIFKNPGLANKALGGWQYSGIMTFETGTPFSVLVNNDNAGVANGLSNAGSDFALANRIGNPRSGIVQSGITPTVGPLLYNPNAYAAPIGLTFGDSGRNSLTNPHRTNFDMALFKHIRFTERLSFEFRGEAFNVFNHKEWGFLAGQGGSGANNSANLNSSTNTENGSNFFHITTAHNPRILQLGAKLIF